MTQKKIIEFRIHKGEFVGFRKCHTHRLYIKKWWGWKLIVDISVFGQDYTPELNSEEECIKHIYDMEKLKPELLHLVQHSTIKSVTL